MQLVRLAFDIVMDGCHPEKQSSDRDQAISLLGMTSLVRIRREA